MSTKTPSDAFHDDPVKPTQDHAQWKRGSVLETSKERVAKMVATKEQISLRLDRDVLQAYRELAQGGSYQQLIHHALRQWLDAQSVAHMVREELSEELAALKKSQAAS